MTQTNFIIAPPGFRRQAIACIPYIRSGPGILEFPTRRRNRLQVSLRYTDRHGQKHVAKNYWKQVEENTAEASLKAAQAEVVHQEIFTTLIKEASNFPTASVRVSERLIAVEATENVDLRLELVSFVPNGEPLVKYQYKYRWILNTMKTQITQAWEHTAQPAT